MQLNVKQALSTSTRTACAVTLVRKRHKLSATAQAFDEANGGALNRAVKAGELDGGEPVLVHLDGRMVERVLLLDSGKDETAPVNEVRKRLYKAAAKLAKHNLSNATLVLDDWRITGSDDRRAARLIAEVFVAQSYRFDETRSSSKPESKFKRVTILTRDRRQTGAAQQGVKIGAAMASGVNLARDLGNRPANICTPTHLAQTAESMKKGQRKLRVQILDEKQMRELGMGSLLSVSAGSRQPAKLIVFEYRGGPAKQKPVVLVGKGVTFDTGGISIKPAASMDEMKFDMCGAASVFGVIRMCTELDLPRNVVGLVPATENMPGGEATRPGDVVTSMSGQTIEILNTDAEGRLILADALSYAERFEPDVVIDIATLTGACIIALGDQASGLMSNDDKLAQGLLDSGEAAGDRCWRLPIWKEYQDQLKSNFADMANVGGRSAGTITAGCFLERFADKYRWAHLDIAGTAWRSGDEKGATGRPVPLLTQYLLERSNLA